VAVVSRADCIPEVEQIVRAGNFLKVRKILPGGKERYDSSLAALNAYSSDDDCLLFHDAVRPFVSERIITDCVKALESFDAVTVAVPTTDTIYRVDDNQMIVNIPPRSHLRNAQTPQGFRAGTIRRAYDVAQADPAFVTTDDCGVVQRYLPEIPIYVVEGDSRNIKVTYPEDLNAIKEKVVDNHPLN
jgi:2-C-methyl-D-erythritol 4-phosphate cytidylyltransferase